jgi:hypothetical protein
MGIDKISFLVYYTHMAAKHNVQRPSRVYTGTKVLVVAGEVRRSASRAGVIEELDRRS